MVNDEFNVSSKNDDTQKNAREDRKREQDIAKIQSEKQQRVARTMLTHRDDAIEKLQAKNDKKELDAVEELTHKIKPEAGMHLKPPNAPAESLESRFMRAKKTVRQVLGKDLDKEVSNLRDKRNAEVDRFVDKAISRQQSSSTKQSTSQSATASFQKSRGRTHKIGHTPSNKIN